MFKSIDWPDTCYVQEAVYWIVFGRVPEFFIDDGGDARSSDNAFETGETLDYYDSGYQPLEFHLAGVPDVDGERYVQAPTELTIFAPGSARTVSATEYLTHWNELLSKSGVASEAPARDDVLRETMDALYYERANERVADYEWRKNLESAIAPEVEKGRSIIFQALITGELPAFGMREIDQESPFERYEISARQWKMTFDWAESELVIDDQVIKSVQISTDDLLKLYPKPLCKPILTTTVDIYPGVAILSDDDEEISLPESKRRGRGRGKLAGGFVEIAVRNWAKEQIRTNGKPAKNDAFVQAAIEFSTKILGHEVKRTTVQGWLKDLLSPVAGPPPLRSAGDS